MPRFTYLPLDDGCQEIRLIRLLPGVFDDDIQVEIFHEPLSEERIPEYEALLYVWGTTEKPLKIYPCTPTAYPTDDKRKIWSSKLRFEKLRSKSRRIRRPHFPLAVSTQYRRALRTSCLSSFEDCGAQVQMFFDSLPLTSLGIFLLPKPIYCFATPSTF